MKDTKTSSSDKISSFPQAEQTEGKGFSAKIIYPQPVQKKENKTGMPDNLRSGLESMSGMNMSDVRVHYNSSKPAQLNALAYAQGSNIYMGPGQEKHLAHEGWHIVQQRQGRVKPTFQAKGVAINDSVSLEKEADVMGSKALKAGSENQSAGVETGASAGTSMIAQRMLNSFPDDAEEKLKEMGAIQKKAAPASSWGGGHYAGVAQLRGGAKVGELKIKTSHVGSSLIAGHAWLSYTPTAGGERTHGTWGNDPRGDGHVGYFPNLEVGRAAAAERGTDLDAGDLVTLNTFVGNNDSWGYINNCSSFAARGWKNVTGESLAYRSLGIPNPSALGVGIVAANGGTTGVLPSDRGSSSTSISSTFSSGSGISSNTSNSLVGSTSVGGSLNASSGRGSL